MKKKCINLANFTYNLYVLYIKLAQNTNQFRRLVLENFITIINFLFGRKCIYGLRPWVLGLLNISPPCVNYGNTYTDKSFFWHTGGGGGDILKMFSDFYIF